MNFDWESVKTLTEAFGQLINNKFLSDIEFKFMDGRSLFAHSFVLSMRSKEYFEIFKSTTAQEKKVFYVQDTTYDTLLEFLKHIYSDKPEVEGDTLELMKLARRYGVEHLENRCSSIVVNRIELKTACELLDMCIEEEFELMEANILEFIAENYEKLLNDETFLEVKEEVLTVILDLDPVSNNDEVLIFEAAMKWATRACEKEGYDDDDFGKRSQLGENLKLIRFAAMSIEEFEKCVEQEPELLTHMEISSITDNIKENSKNPFGFFDQKRTLLNTLTVGVFRKRGQFTCGYRQFVPVRYPVDTSFRMVFQVTAPIELTGLRIMCPKGRLELSVAGAEIDDGSTIYDIKCYAISGWKKLAIRPKINIEANKRYEIRYTFHDTGVTEIFGSNNDFDAHEDESNTAYGEINWAFDELCPQINQLFYSY